MNRGWTCISTCWRCPRTWATPRFPTHTGISPACRSLCASLASASSTSSIRGKVTAGRAPMGKCISTRPPSFAALAQAFFAEHFQQQRAMSPRTVATYRDAFVLFLDFAQARLHKQPTMIGLHEITPVLILAFLDHLEQERGNAVRTRNARLAALRAFLKFAGRRNVNALHVVEQALGVPMKRFELPMLGFLSREEMLAIIGEPEQSWTSQRDHLLLK